MESNGVHHIVPNIKNMDRTVSFYSETPGFRLAKDHHGSVRNVELDAVNVILAVFEAREPDRKAVLKKVSEQGFSYYAFQPTYKCFPAAIEDQTARAWSSD